jgi:hypothetical protein
MQALILQSQLLLAALGALLPLIPEKSRVRIGELFDLVGKALAVGDAAARQLDDLAVKLAAVRADVERMALAGERLTADRIDEAFERVRAASAAFRQVAES